jgi:hypothetical protein
MLRLGDAIKEENNDNIRLLLYKRKISAVRRMIVPAPGSLPGLCADEFQRGGLLFRKEHMLI